MSELRIQPVSLHGFSIEPSFDGSHVAVKLIGTADMRAQRTIASVLRELHAEAMRLRSRKVSVDYRDLEFMNSSCFKEFITWLGDVRALPPSDKYTIRFLSDPRKHWQARSLSALSCFAVDVVEIDPPQS
jgi:hypothetical protein